MHRTLNLGILAHVDAGKTTLTERLLYTAGVIDEIGSVDDGTTQTDTLALERERGITIRSAVVSFAIDDVKVNLIDTPGHPDFIAEVERVLNVLDGAVLVVSAVEGVQAQTRILMRTLQRLRIPTLIFINKIDRIGADVADVLRQIADKLTPAIVAISTVRHAGSRSAGTRACDESDDGFVSSLLDVLTDHDDALLAAVVDGGSVPYARLREKLAAQSKRALVHVVVCGSALTGAGIEDVMTALTEFLPSTAGDADVSPSGTVFKVERGSSGEKIAYVRMFSGAVAVRDRVGPDHKVTGIAVFGDGTTQSRSSLVAGEIGRLWGLADVRVGDAIGVARRDAAHYFAPPTLETVVVPCSPSETGALHAALAQLAEQDPLINLRQDDVRHELFVSLYGEVQKEVIRDTLADEYGLRVTFRETTTICVERPIGSGFAVEFQRTAGNPFLATVGLRIEPAPLNSGVIYRRDRDVLGRMPVAFFKAVEDSVHRTLREGLYGWQVTDCVVTMTNAGYSPRQSAMHQRFNKSMSSTGYDFRGLTPLVMMNALKDARTVVCEPVHGFRLEAPSELIGTILPALGRLHAVPLTQSIRRDEVTVEGEIPAARVHDLRLELRALTRGEGVLECAFDRYEPVSGPPPVRSRSDDNPLNRKEYLLHVTRRI